MKVHMYPNFFMSRLHNKGARTGGYNFEAVGNIDNKIEGGLGTLNELCIPINIDNAH